GSARPSSIEEVSGRLEEIAARLPAKTSISPAAALGRGASPASAEEEYVERRRYRRLPAEMVVKVSERATAKDSAILLFSRAANIGENGIFVKCASPLAVGTFVDIELALEGQKSIVKAVGVVRWMRASGAEPGMGIQFLQVATADRQQLRDFLEERTAAEIVRRLMQSPAHRAILKLVVCHWGQKITLEQLGRVAGASRPILLRALADFEKEKVVRVGGEEVLCVRPESPRLAALLEKAVLGGKAG
ncbi:MAG: PilZ domain-containing protein, partial [Planctomycetota bacterium]|nr:PilZ domain-containing protein [Planctomycetota bacterium]